MTIYLDNGATTRLAPEARDAMLPWLGERWGNPSSSHRLGLAAARAVKEARRDLADALGCATDEVLVCSTGWIGYPLPMDVITLGIPVVAATLDPDGGQAAATAIMTTDTVPRTTLVEAGGFNNRHPAEWKSPWFVLKRQ